MRHLNGIFDKIDTNTPEKTKIIDKNVQMCTYRTLCVEICRKKSEICAIITQNSIFFDKKIFYVCEVVRFMRLDFCNCRKRKFIISKRIDKTSFCAQYRVFTKQTIAAYIVICFNASLRF